MCSWAVSKKRRKKKEEAGVDLCVPGIPVIQSCLVEVGDKPSSFLHSKEWIGCYESCIVLDHLYGVSSKIVHVSLGASMSQHAEMLLRHFKEVGSPVMIGGDKDGASKTLIGIAVVPESNEEQFLIADPHYTGVEDSHLILDGGHVKWHSKDLFDPLSFYNLCLPQ